MSGTFSIFAFICNNNSNIYYISKYNIALIDSKCCKIIYIQQQLKHRKLKSYQ